MANCAVCTNVSSKQVKAVCCDCKIEFHHSRVKINKANVDFLVSEGSIWKCETCSVTRRASLRLESKVNEGKLTC